MNLQGFAFHTTDWDKVPAIRYPGETGYALWRTVEAGNARVRMVEYSAPYKADHWCSRGHVILVLEGELVTTLQDGRSFRLTPGMSYQVAEGSEPHQSSTTTGAKLFIVD
jgi:quercetin dioxygenase-like cupin family protein